MPEDADLATMSANPRKLSVAALPNSVAADVLRQFFKATEALVVEVNLPRKHATMRPHEFGSVTLATTDEADSARESLEGSFRVAV